MHTLLIVRGIRMAARLAGARSCSPSCWSSRAFCSSSRCSSWGWWTAIGGQGNPVTGTTDQTAGTAAGVDRPVVFLLVLLPAIPLFAAGRGADVPAGRRALEPGAAVGEAVQFGLVHALIGIPIGVALALSFGGGVLHVVLPAAIQGHRRPRESMMESTRAHVAYNLEIVTVLLVALVILALGF